ncbi:MAG TPA: APC family permease [Burkholderiales bacterium]|nr:APC family permease [Burkholderiales bacterium]
MPLIKKLRKFIVGAPLDPLKPETRKNIVLIAFLAWVGLGADGLSSSAYGPEEAFLALGSHTHLGLYMAAATAITVFVIALAYNQVIELFPSGGGGYKVASQLLGPHAGLVSGSALIVDYVLTISISVASGVDALFSLLPAGAQPFKLANEIVLIMVLTGLNLRGMKESIKVLLPIFLGFVITHILLIVYGVQAHAENLPGLIPDTLNETFSLAGETGWLFVASLFLRAYSLGGGTYTGIEAVSNNINRLAEPRVRTGKLTMIYMAFSLAFTAGGIIVLYLLWEAKPVQGQTLNAVVFNAIILSYGEANEWVNQITLAVVLALEAGLLLVAANTGFLGGPAVMANMAADSWVPRQFRQLSSRLVTQNGISLMGIAALAILVWTRGSVNLLVVLYSINVFLTFSMSILGLCVHWWRNRLTLEHWRRRLVLSIAGLVITSGILLVTIVEKFEEGGWVTLLITGIVVGVCLLIRMHYDEVREQLRKIDELFVTAPTWNDTSPAPQIDPARPTAVFLVGKNLGVGMHTLLWVQRLFPNHFKNFIFLAAGEVDAQSYGAKETMNELQQKIADSLNYYIGFCHSHGLAAAAFQVFGCDPVDELTELTEKVAQQFPNCVFFASKLIFQHDNFLTRMLHNQTALTMQSRLHLRGMQMVILPMKVS